LPPCCQQQQQLGRASTQTPTTSTEPIPISVGLNLGVCCGQPPPSSCTAAQLPATQADPSTSTACWEAVSSSDISEEVKASTDSCLPQAGRPWPWQGQGVKMQQASCAATHSNLPAICITPFGMAQQDGVTAAGGAGPGPRLHTPCPHSNCCQGQGVMPWVLQQG
jgi:hypothetical protein